MSDTEGAQLVPAQNAGVLDDGSIRITFESMLSEDDLQMWLDALRTIGHISQAVTNDNRHVYVTVDPDNRFDVLLQIRRLAKLRAS
jgi:hypothetical protein